MDWEGFLLYIGWVSGTKSLKGTCILLFAPNWKKVVFWIVASCIAHCCIPRPQRIIDVTNFSIALQVPTMRQRHSCISHGSNVDHDALRSWQATMYKLVTSMVRCGLGMQQCAMHNATIQKTNFFELGVCAMCAWSALNQGINRTPLCLC